LHWRGYKLLDGSSLARRAEVLDEKSIEKKDEGDKFVEVKNMGRLLALL